MLLSMTRLVFFVAAVALSAATPASAEAGRAEIPSAFYIAKSNNRNQVHYAVTVDDACAPVGAAPVHPYWRMLEKSADATEQLEGRELRAFGLERQEVDGDTVRIALRGLPARTIAIRTWRGSDNVCMSTATMTIAGAAARVARIYVKVKLFGVDYVQLTGLSPAGAEVGERVTI
jgi:hypothetical protein